MNSISPAGLLSEFVNRLKFKNLFILITALLIIDLLIPDMIPMLDEIILGILAVILGNLKKKTSGNKSGTVIEGEVIDEEDRR
jgi:hypothetical protein